MNALDEIKSNTCPYCNGRYTIADGGCANKCRLSEFARVLVVTYAEMIDELTSEEMDELEREALRRQKS